MHRALRTDNSPFDEGQLESLNRALAGLDERQSLWLSGYLAGQLAGPAVDSLTSTPRSQTAETLSVFYGSETGNAEGLADALATTAREAGIHVEVASLDGLRPATLAGVEQAVFIVSTHGEGDPPEDALDFFEALEGERAPRLEKLRYRVLALGDRSYTHFCATGIQLDSRLEALGARRIGARVDCDVDIRPGFEAWSTEVLAWCHDHLARPGKEDSRPAARLSVVRSAPTWSREQPFEAEVLAVRPISGQGSVKDVRHLELSLAGAGLDYQPGDALGVWAPNRDSLVQEILDRLELPPDTSVTLGDERIALRQALTHRFELTRLDAGAVSAYAEASGRKDLANSFSRFSDADRAAFMKDRQFADLLEAFPGKVSAEELAGLLRPLAPRSYSIASSADMVGEEVHLTVATLSSRSGGTTRYGVASGHLNLGLEPGQTLRVFPEPNRRFQLPGDDAPIVMIGAGTGIAPYRAFAQQLEADARDREAWLIFGNPSLRTDFLYQRDWLRWRASGRVSRIDGAWSRDGEGKRYVQHVVTEQIGRLEDWLRRGAHLYICGGLAMGRAVQDALGEGLAGLRGPGADGARDVLASLRRDGRLHRDLY